MIGIEFVADLHSKKPNPEFVRTFKQNCLRKGLLFEVGGHHGNVVRLVPPLIVTEKMIDNAVSVMKSALLEMTQNESAQRNLEKDGGRPASAR